MLGILAVIVIPNVSNVQDEAFEVAIANDAKAIQIAVDMYAIKNDGKVPAKEKPSLGNPQVIDFGELVPKYIRKAPEVKSIKYWLHNDNTVWYSTADAPSNVSYNMKYDTLKWRKSDNAAKYRIYVNNETNLVSSSKSNKLILISEIEKENNSEQYQELTGLKDIAQGPYLITAVDKYGFETPPSILDTDYDGYEESVEENNEKETEAQIKFEDLKVGDYINYGKFNGHNLNWQVVSDKNGTLMLFMTEPLKDTNGNIANIVYDTGPNDGEPVGSRHKYGSNNYTHSDVRFWLNSEFFNNSFTNKSNIKRTSYKHILTNIDSSTADSGVETHENKTSFNEALANYDIAYKKT